MFTFNRMDSPSHFYSLRQKIGEGSFGLVYQGFFTKPDQPKKRVAIKVLADSKHSKQEADLMASLPPDPNVCMILDTWVLLSKRYIAMELIDGSSFREWLNRLVFDEPDEPIDWRKIIGIFIQIFLESLIFTSI